MKRYTFLNKFVVYKSSKIEEEKYIEQLSFRIKQTFGEPKYEAETIKEILSFCLDFYIAEFEKVCELENSFLFYKTIFELNETASSLRITEEAMQNLPKDLTPQYIYSYRRILKMILEQGCLIQLQNIDETIKDFNLRFENNFSSLLFLGEMIYTFCDHYAEQEMIEDDIDISFNSKGNYFISRKHHYEDAFKKIVDLEQWGTNNFIIDKNGEFDFDIALQEAFKIKYDYFKNIIAEVFSQKKYKYGDVAIVPKGAFSKAFHLLFKVTNSDSDVFINGLTLSKDNKQPLLELASKPANMNRFLYRPILIWNIEGNETCIFGIHSIFESMNTLIHNCFPFGKSPIEWITSLAFKKFIDRKGDDHDKWLDDVVEEKIKLTGLIYQRDVRKIQIKRGFIKIEDEKCGQLDFLAINLKTKKIFVIECKHLIGRGDMPNWKSDFSNFTNKEKGFDKTIERKINFVKQNINLFEEHFQFQTNDFSLSFKNYTVEGIYIINTPTFWMYNSEHRIYVFHDTEKVLLGTYLDKEYTLINIEENFISEVLHRHPYFRKKEMFYCDDLDDDGEVDEYGDIISLNK
jgi:hypothetical protein